MLPFCRALFDMIYTACLGAIVSKRSSSLPPELNFFNSAKGLHHPTINIQFKSRPLQKQRHEPFVSLGVASCPGGMMLTRPNISSYITRGKGAWREIGVRVLFLGRAHTWWRCVSRCAPVPHVLLRTAASHQAAESSSPSSGHLLHRSSWPSYAGHTMPSSAPSLPPLDILFSHQAFATVAPGN